MSQHIELMVMDLVEQGQTEKDARREARLKFGNPEVIKEDARDAWGLRPLLDFFGNLRFGLRLCVRYPESSLLGIFVMALGVGIAAIMFSASSKMLNVSSGGRMDENIVAFTTKVKDQRKGAMVLPVDAYQLLSREARTFANVTAMKHAGATIHATDEPKEIRQIRVMNVEADFFDYTTGRAQVGRLFSAEDAVEDDSGMMVISDALWEQMFARDREVIGGEVVLSGRNVRLIGVTQQGFAFPMKQQAWVLADWMDERWVNSGVGLNVLATLKPEASLESAQSEIKVLGSAWASSRTWEIGNEPKLGLREIKDVYLGGGQRLLFLLGVILSMSVLGICASNVFHIIMARTASRAHELAARCSMGAKRHHVISQVLVDGVVLSLLGGVAGLGIAELGLRVLTTQLARFQLPGILEFELGRSVVFFGIGSALLTGVVASLIPALRASSVDAFAVLKSGNSNSSNDIHSGNLSKRLLMFQIAGSALMLWVGLVLIGELSLLEHVKLPFKPEHVASSNIRIKDDPKLRNPVNAARYAEKLTSEIVRLPGVRGAAFSSAEMGMFVGMRTVDVPGRDPNAQKKNSQQELVTPGWLDVFDIKLLAGRFITTSDVKDTLKVCVVNEDFVNEFFPDKSPLGEVFRFGRSKYMDGEDLTIVGVVPNIKPSFTEKLDEAIGNTFARVYVPIGQSRMTEMHLVIETHQPIDWKVIKSVHEAVERSSGLVSLEGSFSSFADQISRYDRVRALIQWATSLFGMAVLLVALVGLYAVVSYSMHQRRREIGIRMALGASSWDVTKAVIHPWAKPIFLGLLIGMVEIVVGFALFRMIGSGEATTDDSREYLSLVLSLGLVWIGMVAACLLSMAPSIWRAIRLDPMEVMGAE